MYQQKHIFSMYRKLQKIRYVLDFEKSEALV